MSDRPHVPEDAFDPSAPQNHEVALLAGLERQLTETTTEAPADPAFHEELRAALLTTARGGQAPDTVGLTPRVVEIETAIGTLLALFRGRTLYLLTTASPTHTERARSTAIARFQRVPITVEIAPDWLVRKVEAGLEGRHATTMPDLSFLPDFSRRVLETVRSIVPGEVRSYEWVARQVGSPRAVRAVGTALAKNPLPLVIPCHRVIHSDGTSGSYALGGADVKTTLLEREGVDLPRLRQLAREGMVVQGNRITKIYCLFSCRSAKWSTGRNSTPLHSIEAAQALGYRACKICRPA